MHCLIDFTMDFYPYCPPEKGEKHPPKIEENSFNCRQLFSAHFFIVYKCLSGNDMRIIKFTINNVLGLTQTLHYRVN
jgi:hypothetical protein